MYLVCMFVYLFVCWLACHVHNFAPISKLFIIYFTSNLQVRYREALKIIPKVIGAGKVPHDPSCLNDIGGLNLLSKYCKHTARPCIARPRIARTSI